MASPSSSTGAPSSPPSTQGGQQNPWFFTRWTRDVLAETVNHAAAKAPDLVKPFEGMIDESATTVHPIFGALKDALEGVRSDLTRGQKLKSLPLAKQYIGYVVGNHLGYLKKYDSATCDSHLGKLGHFHGLGEEAINLQETMEAFDAAQSLYHHELGKIGTMFDNIIHTLAAEGRASAARLFQISPPAPKAVTETDQVLQTFFAQTHVPAGPRVDVTEMMLKTKVDLLTDNSVNFAVAMAVLPDGIKPEDFAGVSRAQFRERLFAKIDAIYPRLADRWSAKAKYFLLALPIRFYVSHSVANFINFVINIIDHGDKDQYQSLLRTWVNFLHGQCVAINSAYGHVAEHRTALSGTVVDQVDARLQEKSINRGFTTDEINRNFVHAFVHQFLPRFAWGSRVASAFEKLRFSADSRFGFLNLLIAGVTTPLAWIVKGIFFPVESALNAIVLWKAKQIVVQEKVMERVRDQSREALLGQNYAHALNTLFRDQLREAYQAMSAPKPKDPKKKGTMGSATLGELEGFVANFLKTLQLHKEKDPANLHKLIKDGSLLDRITLGLSDMTGRTVNPTKAIVEAVGEELSVALTTVLTKHQFCSFLDLALENLNKSIFEPGADVTESQKLAVEQEMMDLLGMIVTKATRDALHAQLVPGANAQDRVKAVVERLKEQYRGFIALFDEGFYQQLKTDQKGDAVARVVEYHSRSTAAIRTILSDAEATHHLEAQVIEQVKNVIAEAAKAQMGIVETLRSLPTEGIDDAIEALKAKVGAMAELAQKEAKIEAPNGVGADLTAWEDTIFQVVRGFLASRANEVPGVIREPFVLRKLMNGVLLWYTTGKP